MPAFEWLESENREIGRELWLNWWPLNGYDLQTKFIWSHFWCLVFLESHFHNYVSCVRAFVSIFQDHYDERHQYDSTKSPVILSQTTSSTEPNHYQYWTIPLRLVIHNCNALNHITYIFYINALSIYRPLHSLRSTIYSLIISYFAFYSNEYRKSIFFYDQHNYFFFKVEFYFYLFFQ